MDFATWAPAYRAVLDDFGYDRAADERARDVLGGLCAALDPRRLPSGGTVAVAGAGPSLPAEAGVAADADAVFAASAAAAVLDEEGVAVDCLVTDLDKTPATAARLSHEGVPVAVHAHGDNVPAVRDAVPRLAADRVLPTTQAAPAGHVRNFGGFTDGDRAAFLADHCGADRLVFPGWDLDDPTVSETKRRKLRWAERLLYWLERRRGESFSLLDGRRNDLSLPWLD